MLNIFSTYMLAICLLGKILSVQVLCPFLKSGCFLDTELYESFVYLAINLSLDISFAASVEDLSVFLIVSFTI